MSSEKPLFKIEDSFISASTGEKASVVHVQQAQKEKKDPESAHLAPAQKAKENGLTLLPPEGQKKTNSKKEICAENTSLKGTNGESSFSHSVSFSESGTFSALPAEGATVVMSAPLYKVGNKVRSQTLYSCLMCLLGPDELIGKCWPVKKREISMGRSRKCDICIPDPALSKKHLLIYHEEGNKTFVADQSSTNGTLLDEEKLKANTKVELKDNQKITLGKTVLRFLDKSNPEIISIQENFEKAFHDALTGLENRFALESRAPALFRQSRQYHIPLSLIIFDIDYFKQVNDTHGHLAGDFVLKEVVQVVKPCFRAKDLFARSGGEEFCIMIQSRSQRAKNAIETARQKVEKHVFQYEGKTIKVTISAGVACQNTEDKEWKTLYERADKQLYKAKTTGRNKVLAL